MKELKDYIHLYLGCKIMTVNNCYKGILKGVCESEYEKGRIVAIVGSTFNEVYVEDARPILRPLSDMTKEERNEYHNFVIVRDRTMNDIILKEAAGIQYLLYKSFDLFGLIEAGLAIDKTKLPANA